MAIMEIPAEARTVALLRQRKELDELDYRRGLRDLKARGYTQRQVARWLGITQPSLSSALRTAEAVPLPLEGFSGATPTEVCQRYAAGLIDRSQLVDELTRWPYIEGGHTDGYDSLIVDPPGAWSEVPAAVRAGLVDEGVYDEVFERSLAAQEAGQVGN